MSTVSKQFLKAFRAAVADRKVTVAEAKTLSKIGMSDFKKAVQPLHLVTDYANKISQAGSYAKQPAARKVLDTFADQSFQLAQRRNTALCRKAVGKLNQLLANPNALPYPLNAARQAIVTGFHSYTAYVGIYLDSTQLKASDVELNPAGQRHLTDSGVAALRKALSRPDVLGPSANDLDFWGAVDGVMP